MPTRDIDTRSVGLVDIPLVRRLIDQSTVLDSELAYTRDTHDPNGTLISSILLPQRSLHTLVTRAQNQQVIGQFRIRSETQNAHIVYVAPSINGQGEDTAWLHVLDAMAREAGKDGAHALLAEVDEQGRLFETMRTAGYAVYARQEIWGRQPGDYTQFDEGIELVEETEADAYPVQTLLTSTVPSLVLQYAIPPADMPRLIYRDDKRIVAYIAYSEGRHGVYMIPYLHPDIISDAPAVIEAAIRRIPRTSRVPVFVCVRRYQDWILEALAEMRFEPQAQQAVMVKHIAAGVRHPSFAPLHQQYERVPKPVKPPTVPMVKYNHHDNADSA